MHLINVLPASGLNAPDLRSEIPEEILNENGNPVNGNSGHFAVLLDEMAGKNRNQVVLTAGNESIKDLPEKEELNLKVLSSLSVEKQETIPTPVNSSLLSTETLLRNSMAEDLNGIIAGVINGNMDGVTEINPGFIEIPVLAAMAENQIPIKSPNMLQQEGLVSNLSNAEAAQHVGAEHPVFPLVKELSSKELSAKELSSDIKNVSLDSEALSKETLSAVNKDNHLLRNLNSQAENSPIQTANNSASGLNKREAPVSNSSRSIENLSKQFIDTPKQLAAGSSDENSKNSESIRRRGADHRSRDNRSIEVRTGDVRPGNTSEALISSNSMVNLTDRAEVLIPVDLSISNGQAAGERTVDGVNSRNSGLEELLSRELRENLGNDIVRQASILVKNAGEGTIRLSLQPESLGNVKIRLEMTENKIIGHIVVESSEALRAFERELPVLQKAFQDSGFSQASLDMSMAQGNEYKGPDQSGETERMDLAATRYELETDSRETISEGIVSSTAGRTAVNMLI